VLIDDGIMKEMGPTNPNTISDGLDKTIAFVESRMEASIPWMEPVDLSVSEFLAYNFQTQMSDHTGGTHVATADGSIFFITNSIDKETLAGLLTGSGGESVDFYW
jgi:hypothetical protein